MNREVLLIELTLCADIKRKLERLNSLWGEVQKATQDRSRSLEEALAIAERFWEELQSVMATLRDLQDSLVTQEPPAVRPEEIQHQQKALQEIRAEIDQVRSYRSCIRSRCNLTNCTM